MSTDKLPLPGATQARKPRLWVRFCVYIEDDPHNSLLSQGSVRVLVLVIIIGVVGTALSIGFNTDLVFGASGTAFNLFATEFKFSIGFLAAGLAALGILAAHHRSSQLARQMTLMADQIAAAKSQRKDTIVQYRFTNYYKHREEFFRHLDLQQRSNSPEAFSDTELDRRALHLKLFPLARNGDYKLDPELIKKFEDMLKGIIEYIKAIEKGGDIRVLVSRLENNALYVIWDLGFGDLRMSGTNYTLPGQGSPISVPRSPKQFFLQFISRLNKIGTALSFENFIRTSEFTRLTAIDVTKIVVPSIKVKNDAVLGYTEFIEQKILPPV